MICTACRKELVIVETRGVELDLCADCHGTWFDADELRQLFRAVDAPSAVLELEDELARRPSKPAAGRRLCPRCRGRLREVAVAARPEPIALDRCPMGDGLWFDAGELRRLVQTSEFSSGGAAFDRLKEHFQDFLGPKAAP